MECGEVQKRLSAYIEKVVSPKQKALIDAHLKGCRQCKDARADLKRAIEHVKKLEEVEPPAWLVQKVMAQVRSEAGEKRGVLQKLFYPFHIKLPLEAAAVIFIAVGAIYIFKAMQPEMRLAKAPIEQKETAPRVMAPEKEGPPARDEGRPAPARSGDQSMYEKGVAVRKEKEVEEAQAPAAMARQEEAAPAVGYTDHAQLRRDVAPSSKGVRPKVAVATKEQGVLFVVNVKDIAIASRDIEGIVRQLGGKAIKTEPLEDKAVIAVELDSQKVKELFDQLTLIGEVQEKGLALEGREGVVEVRVEVERSPHNP